LPVCDPLVGQIAVGESFPCNLLWSFGAPGGLRTGLKGANTLVANEKTEPASNAALLNPNSASSSGLSPAARALRAAQVIVISSVTFTFISYWRTAAVVLCDLASTAYYIGAIVESAIGKAAPWFIVGVLLFSYAMRSVYIESCSLFVRGGVYRVVKEAMGGFVAKLSVSALLFDYILTGPISGVTAGQYIVGLCLDALSNYMGVNMSIEVRQAIKSWGAVAIACVITLYFFRQNLLGIHESSDKALKIMIATTIMGLVILAWSGVTLAVKGPVNPVPTWRPDLQPKTTITDSDKVIPKINPVTGRQEDPLGFLGRFPAIADPIRNAGATGWLGLLGVIGIVIAFGHSILAMSGEETLAQVYREVESPKLKNFKKAAFIVFVYSLLLTGTVSFLAMILMSEKDRMVTYYDNLIGGLAMKMVGPIWLTLLLNAFVVTVGFLILSGAVNTSIIGSNGVLNRVAEDGVLPDWFLKPHAHYGTTSRMLWLIVGLQLFTIVASRGDFILLGEAYAFGVVWSFTFKTLSMVVLRFKDHTPREFRVPLNIKVGKIELPIGLGLISIIMLFSAIANLLTKEVATISGAAFSAVFLTVFIVTESVNEKRRGIKHVHLEQFNQQVLPEIKTDSLGLTKPYRKLVAIRSPHNLFMLEKALAESDPNTTDVVVMTAKVAVRGGETNALGLDLDTYDQQLMTAVVERAERVGKKVRPLIVPTNSPLHAILQVAKEIQAQEVVVGASNKFTAEEQLDQMAFYWINAHDGRPPGLTVRVLSRDRDVYFDVEGGNRIPTLGERRARSVADLRAAGVGIDKVLLIHDSTPGSSDLFFWVLTMIDPKVVLDVAAVPPPEETASLTNGVLQRDQERARTLGRDIRTQTLGGNYGAELVRLAREGHYELIIAPLPQERPMEKGRLCSAELSYVLAHAHCPVFLGAHPVIPTEVEN
jgi:amino acid transporter/nucleotide-binding universal stress UspA family protein